MRKIKQLLSIGLALVMSFALAIPVLATESTGSLTVTNVRPGETYRLYKVLNATYQPSASEPDAVDKGNYYYTVTPEFKPYFEGKFNGDTTGTYTNVNSATQIYQYVNAMAPSGDADKQRSFSADLVKYVDDEKNTVNNEPVKNQKIAEITVAPGKNTITFVNLGYGYYLLIPTFAVTGSGDEGAGATRKEGAAVFMLTTVQKAVEIQNKSQYPTPNKIVIDDNDDSDNKKMNFASIGEKLTFKVNGNMPDVRGYTKFYFEIDDEMENMTYVENSASLSLGNLKFNSIRTTGDSFVEKKLELKNQVTDSEATEYTLKYKLLVSKDNYSHKTKIELILDDLKPLYGKYVDVGNGKYQYTFDHNDEGAFTYQATVDKTATIGGSGNNNSVKLIYSKDPNTTDLSTSKESKTTTFVLGLDIKKVSGNTRLVGSEFELQKQVRVLNPDYSENSDLPQYINQYQTIFKTDDSGRYSNNIVFEDQDTIENDGPNFIIKGLDVGQYRLIETASPKGYIQLEETLDFKILAQGVIDTSNDQRSLSSDTSVTKVNITNGDSHFRANINASSGMVSLVVTNEAQKLLPSTGGAGLYIVAGVAIVALLGFGGTAMLKRKVNGED